MININLIPFREYAYFKEKRKFTLYALIILLLVFCFYTYIYFAISKSLADIKIKEKFLIAQLDKKKNKGYKQPSLKLINEIDSILVNNSKIKIVIDEIFEEKEIIWSIIDKTKNNISITGKASLLKKILDFRDKMQDFNIVDIKQGKKFIKFKITQN